jgi:hypothetical protein
MKVADFEKLTELLPGIFVDLGTLGAIQVDTDTTDKAQAFKVTVRSKAGGVLAEKVYATGDDPIPGFAMIEDMKKSFVAKK